MTELQNLLLAQFRFVQEPSASNWQEVEQAMYTYQAARYNNK